MLCYCFGGDHVLHYFNIFRLRMALLVRPGVVELSMDVPEGVMVTRVVLNQGVHMREIVTRPSRIFMKIDVYGDFLLLSKVVYPTMSSKFM